MQKTRLGLLFGGRSTEHEVSLASAGNIARALDPQKHQLVLIGIDKQGQWHHHDAPHPPKQIGPSSGTPVFLERATETQGATLRSLEDARPIETIDVFFPILHGTFGEDGTIQGLLRAANAPFVGADLLSSAISMDKDIAKGLLCQAGLPNAASRTFRHKHKHSISYTHLREELGPILFVKPASLGSSVGVHKVQNEQSLQRAVEDAFQYDHKILIEEAIEGREIECSVLGIDEPTASIPGEIIIPQGEFYTYDAKYIDEHGAQLTIPAALTPTQVQRVQEMAIAAFEALQCEGMARVDFFLTPQNELLINEINTLPGFTNTSMVPKLWEASGLSYAQLLDRLIQLARTRFRRQAHLRTSYTP